MYKLGCKWLTAILTVRETRLKDPRLKAKQKVVQNSLPVLVSQPLVSKSLNQISDPLSDLWKMLKLSGLLDSIFDSRNFYFLRTCSSWHIQNSTEKIWTQQRFCCFSNETESFKASTAAKLSFLISRALSSAGWSVSNTTLRASLKSLD